MNSTLDAALLFTSSSTPTLAAKVLRATIQVDAQLADRVRAEAACELFSADGQGTAADGLVFLRVTPALFRRFEIQFIQPDRFGGDNSGREHGQ